MNNQSRIKTLFRYLIERTLSPAVLASFTFIMTSCDEISPDYAAQIATARTGWNGNEIIGVWVSKLNAPLAEARRTLLIAPGGKGRIRATLNGGLWFEGQIEWVYAGTGVWQADIRVPGKLDVPKATMQYNGSKLLFKEPVIGGTEYVTFVRADDTHAMQEEMAKPN